jgi:hypothetical protein
MSDGERHDDDEGESDEEFHGQARCIGMNAPGGKRERCVLRGRSFKPAEGGQGKERKNRAGDGAIHRV